MVRSYKGYQFRLYPTREQQEQLRKIFSAVHFTYNRLLMKWAQHPGMDFHAALDDLIQDNPWLAFINKSILTHTADNLQRNCRNNIKAYGPLPSNADQLLRRGQRETGPDSTRETGKAARKMPRFKTLKDDRTSFTISSANDIYIRYNQLTLGGQRGLRPIRVVQSRALPRGARVCSATVSLDRSGEYMVSLLCSVRSETDPDLWKHSIGFADGLAVVGLNYSASSFFASSDSYLRPDDQLLSRMSAGQCRLTAAQKRLSGMQKGSANYEKQRTKIARMLRRLTNQRNDYLQKLSTKIADRYDIVCVESADPAESDSGGYISTGWSQDNGWGSFVSMLEYKLRDRGKKLVRISGRFPSVRRCHECSYINRDLSLSETEWICPVCGAHHNRDMNTSLNIRDEGVRILLQQERRQIGMDLGGLRRRHPEPGGYGGSFRTPPEAQTSRESDLSLAAEDIRVYTSDETYYSTRFREGFRPRDPAGP